MRRKKKFKGYRCKVCNRMKSNSKFSIKGHRNHICKKCEELSEQERNEMIRMREIRNITEEQMFLSDAILDKVKEYAEDDRYPKVQKRAKKMVEEYYNNTQPTYEDDYDDEDELYIEDEEYIDDKCDKQKVSI